MSELGRNEGCNSKAFESWDCVTKGITMLGSRKWPDPASAVVGRTGKYVFEPTLADPKQNKVQY